MTKQETILQLKDLMEHCKDFYDGKDSIWAKDIMALDIAIDALEKQTPKKAIETISKHCSQYNVVECDRGKCDIKDWCRELEENRLPEDWEV